MPGPGSSHSVTVEAVVGPQVPRRDGALVRILRFCLLVTVTGLGVIATAVPGWGDEFHLDFESPEPICRAGFDPQRVSLKTHERNQSLGYAGQSAERLQFVSAEYDVPVVIECSIPPARVLDELVISLAVFCNRPGMQLSARVVFPNQKDPKTGQPLTRIIQGDMLEKANSWQQLTCRTSDRAIAQHLILWRASLKPVELDPREMYIDRIILQQTLGRGMTEVLLDELRVSPIVKPDAADIEMIEKLQPQASGPRIQFQLDRLEVDGRPIFPLIVPYQREPVELFSQLGANVVWVDNFQNQQLINQLNQQGVWATAWPPSAKSQKGEILDALEANLLPFGPETDGILFWNLGVRIEPASHPQLKHWVHQIKSSDRERKRPVLADVTGKETVFSRDVDILGISKHILQTSYSFADYTEHLRSRRLLAQPGTFMMSWVQTEPARAVAEYRRTSGLEPAVIEPEQIRLQAYTALCAGCKGLGFWNWSPLNGTNPGNDERRLVLEQLFQEFRLLEPFLATGEIIHRFEVPLTAVTEGTSPRNGRARGDGNAVATAATEKSGAGQSESRSGDRGNPPDNAAAAAVLRSEHGLLILLNALEKDAQYVPGPLGQTDLRLMIRGLPESAFLWEVTTTGLWPLETRRVTGGTEVRLPRFNMTAALMVATDQGVAQEMERKIQKLQPRAAQLAVELAEAKYARVLSVDEQLIGLSVGLPEISQILEQSRRTLDLAREAMVKQQYHQARTNAELASQLLRIAQRLHWQHATRNVTTPTSIPHTLCFQTLPDYWRLIQQLGRGDALEVTSVRTGRFEDPDAMRVEGWTKDVTTSKDVVVYDRLDPAAVHEGEYCLRMVSVPAESATQPTLDEPAITYRSPAIPVKPGELLYVTGWVRLPRPVTSSLDGFRIYDSQFGAATAIRWTDTSDWKQFELIRPIWKQEQLHLHLELNGFGDVAVDDLRVKLIQMEAAPQLRQASGSETAPSSGGGKSRSNPLDFFNRLIK